MDRVESKQGPKGPTSPTTTDIQPALLWNLPAAEAPHATSARSDQRLHDLGYKSEFRRDMSLFGVLGISFCAIGILTGMSSAFQTGLFSGGPLGLFWGWNVSALGHYLDKIDHLSNFGMFGNTRSAACLCFSSPCHWPRYAVRSTSAFSTICCEHPRYHYVCLHSPTMGGLYFWVCKMKPDTPVLGCESRILYYLHISFLCLCSLRAL